MARLIDADALKQTFQRWANVPEYNEAERHIIRAAMIAVDDCPTIGGWISVKDRLPPNDSTKVLTYGNPVTHWMPLPEPPKEEDDATD